MKTNNPIQILCILDGRIRTAAKQATAASCIDKDDHSQSQPPSKMPPVADEIPFITCVTNTIGINELAKARTSADLVKLLNNFSWFKYVASTKDPLTIKPANNEILITCAADTRFRSDWKGMSRASNACAAMETDSHNCAAVNPKLNVKE